MREEYDLQRYGRIPLWFYLAVTEENQTSKYLITRVRMFMTYANMPQKIAKYEPKRHNMT
jgi:hypothetical protein